MKRLRFNENVLGCVISGAGSSILIISLRNDLEKIKDTVKETWADMNIKANIKTLNVEQNGALIISDDED